MFCMYFSIFGAASSGDVLQLMLDREHAVAVFDRSLQEPILGKPFSELIENNKNRGVCTLFARVESVHGAAMYDACAFNKAYAQLKGYNFDVHQVQDFLANTVRPTVRYFMLDEHDSDKAYTIGSLEGIITSPARKKFIETVFFANNPDIDFEQRCLAFVTLGNKYARGEGLPSKDRLKALYWLEKGLNQDKNARAQAQARFHLGVLYKKSEDIEGHLAKARSYFEQAASQEASVGSKEHGKLQLAKLDELEGNVERACSVYRYLSLVASLDDVRNESQQRLACLTSPAELYQPQLYGLEDKRTEPEYYDSPSQTRHLFLQASYQTTREVAKSAAFIDAVKLSEEHPLVDQNTPPRSNESSSSE